MAKTREIESGIGLALILSNSPAAVLKQYGNTNGLEEHLKALLWESITPTPPHAKPTLLQY